MTTANYERYLKQMREEESYLTLPTKKLFERLNALGYDDGYIFNCNFYELEDIVVGLKPNGFREISSICYYLSLYAEWYQKENNLDNDDTFQMIKSLDRRRIWIKAKPNASEKFICNDDFEDLIKDIEMNELSSLYKSTLFRAIYEGIYNSDMSVVKNLRAADIDINKNIVTLKNNDGESFDLRISEELAKDLIELSKVEDFTTRNRYGEMNLKLTGLYPDSCFKLIGRTDGKTSFRHAYYKKIRKICKEYLGRNITSKQIFASGILYRVAKNLKKEGFTVEEAFELHSRNRKVGAIISDELQRCHYDIPVYMFRELLSSHLDVFEIN